MNNGERKFIQTDAITDNNTQMQPSLAPNANASSSSPTTLSDVKPAAKKTSIFSDIGKYITSGFKSITKSIKKDKTSSKTNIQTGAVNEVKIAQVSTSETAKKTASEENQNFFSKLWKILNSDLSGGKNKKLSEKKLAAIKLKKEKLLQELNSIDAKRLDNGVMYVYKALTKSGKIETGRLYGFSKLDINAYLLSEGYDPYEIVNNKLIDFLYGDTSFSSRRMKMKDLIFLLTQITTYVKAGITITDSMKILMNQSVKDKTKLGIYRGVVYELTMGKTFSEAMESQGTVFPPLLINMLKAAEAMGELEETLDDMVDYYTDIESTRKEMVSAMTYPALVTVFAIGVITFILLYVLPKFSGIYDSMDVQITGVTAFLLKSSTFLQNNILIIVLFVIIAIVAIVYAYTRVKSFRKSMQLFLMKLPVIGNIIVYNEMTLFAKTFSSLLRNNVNITQSIGILNKITNNEIYKEIMTETIDNISRGDRISQAFKDNFAIPDVAYHMIVTGESTGQLSEMMGKVAKFYQEQHHNLVTSLKSLVEPVLICSLAVIVGGIIIAVIVPMFDMYNNISMG